MASSFVAAANDAAAYDAATNDAGANDAFIPVPSSSKAPKPNYCPTNEHLLPDDFPTLMTHMNNILEKHKKGYFRDDSELFVKELGDNELFRTVRRAGCPTLLLNILDGNVPLDDPLMCLLLGMCPKKLRSGQAAGMSTSEAFTGSVLNAAYR